MSTYIQPDFHHCAVLTIDMQNDFALPGAVAEVTGTAEVIPEISDILKVSREQQVPIIHVVRLYKQDGSNADACRKALIESGLSVVRPGTNGADLVEAIKPAHHFPLNEEDLLKGKIQPIAAGEWIMYKPRWGAFYDTGLEQFFKDNHIDTLIFTGCNFPNCPRTSIYEASERDFKIVLVSDAVSGVYEKGVAEMKNIGVTVIRSAEIKAQLKGISTDQ